MFINLVECPTWLYGWIDGKPVNLGCLHFLKNQTMTWYEARDYCKTLKYEHLNNARLVEISDSTQQAFVKEKLLEINNKAILWWTGLTDNEQLGVWKWATSGNKATYIPWGPGEPNIQNEHCVTLWYKINYKWCDLGCHGLPGYPTMPICQFDF